MDDMQIATWAASFGLLIIIATCFGSPLTTADPRGSCQYGNKAFAIGETFMKNECQPCVCAEENYGPSVNCVYINCAPTHCVNPTYSSSQCCGECPDGLNCQHGDKVLKEGEVYTEGGVTCRCEFVPQQYGPAYRAVCNTTHT
ncbi:von Willebrand factor C domain-containing protein 2-like isoform X2 [Haliotis rufescens]|uniref:von Willebrand factor C domain-containing protein 2-like isoform X2 n=1 Tax=Haliotis rufescens TaxID=6454 RepID=UPI00201EE200|nr:von Willebrand factor C domain-containing protein 2-like isoform X2 [Haliotis rufescens]